MKALQGGRITFLPKKVAIVALVISVSCCGTIQGATAQNKLPLEFTPVEVPTPSDPCAPTIICDSSSYPFPECRKYAAANFGAGRYFLYRWDKQLTDPTPLLALGAVARKAYISAGCVKVTVEQPASPDSLYSRPVATITVLSNKYSAFFDKADAFLWSKEQRINFWLDLFLVRSTTPPEPTVKPEPSSPPGDLPDRCGSPSKFQNRANPLDASGDGHVSALDSLLVVRWLREKPTDLRRYDPNQESGLRAESLAYRQAYPDVNGDCFVTEDDSQRIQEHLNKTPPKEGPGTPGVPMPPTNPNPIPGPTRQPDPTQRPLPPQVPNPNPTVAPGPSKLPTHSPNPQPQPPVEQVEVSISVSGPGSVRSSDGNMQCAPTTQRISNQICRFRVALGSVLSLVATPNPGARFLYWATPLFSSFSPTLTFTATKGSMVSAIFSSAPAPSPIPSRGPTVAPMPTKAPTPWPTQVPTRNPTAPPAPTNNPNPAPVANVFFRGKSGHIVSTDPRYSAFQGCQLRDGRCAALLPPGSRLDVMVASYDGNGRRFSYAFCRSRLGTTETRRASFTIFVPSNDAITCDVFYGEDGGHTIRVVGARYYGTPVFSDPAGKISCNGSNHNTCETQLAVGSTFKLTYPQFIQLDKKIGSPSLTFCNYYCRSWDGRSTVTGRRGQNQHDFGTVSTDWDCTANYYELPCTR